MCWQNAIWDKESQSLSSWPNCPYTWGSSVLNRKEKVEGSISVHLSLCSGLTMEPTSHGAETPTEKRWAYTLHNGAFGYFLSSSKAKPAVRAEWHQYNDRYTGLCALCSMSLNFIRGLASGKIGPTTWIDTGDKQWGSCPYYKRILHFTKWPAGVMSLKDGEEGFALQKFHVQFLEGALTSC